MGTAQDSGTYGKGETQQLTIDSNYLTVGSERMGKHRVYLQLYTRTKNY